MAMWIIFLMRIRPSASNTWAGMYLNLNIKQVFDQSVFVRRVQLPKEQWSEEITSNSNIWYLNNRWVQLFWETALHKKIWQSGVEVLRLQRQIWVRGWDVLQGVLGDVLEGGAPHVRPIYAAAISTRLQYRRAYNQKSKKVCGVCFFSLQKCTEIFCEYHQKIV